MRFRPHRDRPRRRVSRGAGCPPSGNGRNRSRHAGHGRGRTDPFSCRAGLSRAGADRQRLRSPRPRVRLSPRQSARPQHGRPGREAHAPRRARGYPLQPEVDAGAMSAKAELRLVDGLQLALERQALHMVYQPKVSMRDGSLAQVEALVRWDDPELGTVGPARFVPLAEQHGLIDDLTHWGLRTILRQWLEWRQQGIDAVIAFNISALSLQHLDFPDLVQRMCRALNVPTDRIVLELTEGATPPLVKMMDALTRFRIKGIGLAIDDFGTGYSSLMQLRQLPFTEVKIDQAFVADAPHSRDCRLIIQSVAELAKGLGLLTTAEGVETIEQLSIVRALGCDYVQGYPVSPPLEPTALKPWTSKFRRAWPAMIAEGKLALWGDVEADSLG